MKKHTNMIRLRLATLALALVAFTGVGQAQEALKIGTVDIGKVFNGYWKTQLSRSQSAERRADFQKIEQGMIDEIKQIEQELIRLAESVRDPANSKAKQEADAKKYLEAATQQVPKRWSAKVRRHNRFERFRVGPVEQPDAAEGQSKHNGKAMGTCGSELTGEHVPILPDLGWYCGRSGDAQVARLLRKGKTT